MQKIFCFVALVVLSFNSTSSAQIKNQTPSKNKVQLSEEKVKSLVLQQGLEAKEVEVKYGQYALAPTLVMSQYNWNLVAETGYEWDKSVTVISTSNTGQAEYERFRTTVGLNRYFTTGTYLGLEISRLALDMQLPPDRPNNAPHQVLNNAGIVLEQAIWGNFLGAGDRAKVRAAELTYDAQKIEKLDELENILVNGIRQYWGTFIAKIAYEESINARDRYRQLANNVTKNARLSNTNPGDLSQVRAELESKEQDIRKRSVYFESEKDKLLTLLNLPLDSEVEFDAVPAIPKIKPELSQIDLQSLRPIKTQVLKSQAANEDYEATKSTSRPKVNLVARANSSGIGTESSDAQDQLLSGSHPKYYIGLKLQHTFGTDINEEQIRNKRLAKELEEIKLQRSLMNIENKKDLLERNLLTAYEIAQSNARQKEFRKRAAEELTRSYNLGRVEISSYIIALNNYYSTEVLYAEAMANLRLAEQELLAFKDELIKN